MNLLAEALAWLADPAHWSGAAGIPTRVGQHMAMTAAAVLLAAAVAVPAGIAVGHTRRGSGAVAAATGAARAIPSLGLLTLFGLWLGIGLEAPLLTLVVLAVPSLLAGVYSGFMAVDPAIPQAARAVGFSGAQVVWLVETPLALPVMLGGLRAATLQVVATATLAAYTADFGLGRYLFAGLKTRDYAQMLGGSMVVIALALLLEVALATCQRLSYRIADPAGARLTTPSTT
ncbi:ABC transporter permease [Tessaracoccus sp. G1721]